MNKSGH
ncbi:hypothetical protein LINPERPRIM_LOCUS7582 [Linum perenne]